MQNPKLRYFKVFEFFDHTAFFVQLDYFSCDLEGEL